METSDQRRAAKNFEYQCILCARRLLSDGVPAAIFLTPAPDQAPLHAGHPLDLDDLEFRRRQMENLDNTGWSWDATPPYPELRPISFLCGSDERGLVILMDTTRLLDRGCDDRRDFINRPADTLRQAILQRAQAGGLHTETAPADSCLEVQPYTMTIIRNVYSQVLSRQHLLAKR